ncbi:hypothetical protein AAG906_000708 [Vitis piasezkii]
MLHILYPYSHAHTSLITTLLANIQLIHSFPHHVPHHPFSFHHLIHTKSFALIIQPSHTLIYIDRIFKYSGCSPSCFVVVHIYVDRFLQHTDAHLTSLNVHRLLITSVMVTAKFIDDWGGVSTAELNRLEMKFLFSLDFRLQVTVETFRSYCSQLEGKPTGGLPKDTQNMIQFW